MLRVLSEKISPYISIHGNYEKAMRLFEILACLWILFHCYKLLGVTSLIDSQWSFCPKVEAKNIFSLDTILWRMGGHSYFMPGVLCQALCAGFIILKGSSWLSRAALWLLTINVFSFCHSIGDGGTSLLCTLLFLYIFCDRGSWREKEPEFARNCFNALVLFSLQFQIAIVYLQAALSKIRSEGWASGVALHYILQVPEFSNPVFSQWVLTSDWMIVFFTYATIGFQLTFPFALFHRHAKLIWLFLGVLFHIGIALCMGLFSFGLFMICVYVVFLSNEQVEWLYNCLRSSRNFAVRYVARICGLPRKIGL